ncbi:MAG: hypothetical protein ACI35W_02490 [Anaeroplasmataceae bacterium]
MNTIYDLKKIRKSTKIKLVFMILATIFPIVLVTLLTAIKRDGIDQTVVQVLRYVISFAGEAFILYKMIMYIIILKSDSFAEKFLIKKNDERLIFIRQKYSSFSLKLILFIVLIGIIVSGFLNTTIFYTLLVVMGVMLLSCGFTILYYTKKY